jgi:hypothetical protein
VWETRAKLKKLTKKNINNKYFLIRKIKKYKNKLPYEAVRCFSVPLIGVIHLLKIRILRTAP